MQKWVIGGCALAVAIVAALVFAPSKATPPAPPKLEAPAQRPVAEAPKSAEPAVLTTVIDVTDIDPLLDPPAIPLADAGRTPPTLRAVGYEEPATTPPATPARPVVPIPPAAEDEQLERSSGPMSRLIGPNIMGPLLLDQEVAASALPDWVSREHDLTFIHIGVYNFESEEKRASRLKATLLAPLLLSTDAYLLALPSEVQDAGAEISILDSLCDVFHVTNQAPRSRSRWYARWYGDKRIPRQATVVPDARPGCGSNQAIFSFVCGLFGGN